MGKSLEVKQRQVAGYCQSIVNTEISTADGIRRDREEFTMFFDPIHDIFPFKRLLNR